MAGFLLFRNSETKTPFQDMKFILSEYLLKHLLSNPRDISTQDFFEH